MLQPRPLVVAVALTGLLRNTRLQRQLMLQFGIHRVLVNVASEQRALLGLRCAFSR